MGTLLNSIARLQAGKGTSGSLDRYNPPWGYNMVDSVVAGLLIFCLRCVDVSLGTLRLVLTIQGRRNLAALIGFVEVSVFITAVAGVVQGPLDPFRVLGYGGGFAMGTFLGLTMERRLALGSVIVRVITRHHGQLVKALVASGFGVTVVEGRGGRGTAVGIVFSVVRRRRLEEYLGVVQVIDRDSTVSIEEVRQQHHGYFAPKRPVPATL